MSAYYDEAEVDAITDSMHRSMQELERHAAPLVVQHPPGSPMHELAQSVAALRALAPSSTPEDDADEAHADGHSEGLEEGLDRVQDLLADLKKAKDIDEVKRLLSNFELNTAH